MTKATIRVPGLKVAVPLAADALPRDLVPTDGPAGEPTLDLVLEGGSLTVRAKLNGKNYRKMLKQIAEHGAANVAVVLQGVLRPPAAAGRAVRARRGRLPGQRQDAPPGRVGREGAAAASRTRLVKLVIVDSPPRPRPPRRFASWTAVVRQPPEPPPESVAVALGTGKRR